jgi:hypothetical protein
MKRMALIAAVGMLTACQVQSQEEQPVQSIAAKAPRLQVTEDVAAQNAAACIGWPEEVTRTVALRRDTVFDPNQPAPYLNFQQAATITVDASGTCSAATESRIISVEPIRNFPPHWLRSTGDQAHDRIWFLIMIDRDLDGNRTFVLMEGTLGENMPFERPVRNAPMRQVQPSIA